MRKAVAVLLFTLFLVVGVAGAATSAGSPEVSDCLFIIPFGHGLSARPNGPVALEVGVSPSCSAGTIGDVRLSLRGRGDGETMLTLIPGEGISLEAGLRSPILLSFFRIDHGRGEYTYSVVFRKEGKEFRTPPVRFWAGVNVPGTTPTILSAGVVAEVRGSFELQLAVRNFGPPDALVPVRLRVLYDRFVGEMVDAEARPSYIGSADKTIRLPFPTGSGTVVGPITVLLLDHDGFQIPAIVERVPDALLRR